MAVESGGPNPDTSPSSPSSRESSPLAQHSVMNGIVRTFLESDLSLILVLLGALLGLAALLVTPREVDPQIVVPLADVHVDFPGHSAKEVEQLVTTPLEKILYQIDGVEYVYSKSDRDHAVITVRYYVGEDRERGLVKLFKKIDENIDLVPPGVTGWVVKPVEIDDVPIVTLTLTSGTSSSYMLRRVAEELTDRLAGVEDISRAYVIGGHQRTVNLYLSPDRMQAYNVSPLEIKRALQSANMTQTAGDFTRHDELIQVEVGKAFKSSRQMEGLVVGVFEGRPVFLKDVARIEDGPAERTSFVRHGWGPARKYEEHPGAAGTLVGPPAPSSKRENNSQPAVTIALAKKRGTNAVWVAESIIEYARELKKEVVPDDMEMVITRNMGMTSNDKVNELVEALGVAVFLVIAVLTIGLGVREALIVAVAVPVVFGLTLSVNFLFGYTINRVTLFALILSLGLLVDDPIVDVENISRHFVLRKRATRTIVLEAVAEIRPPLIIATLAVIVSFLPMFFITGMMGPYMRPMALNVPTAMLMSMFVAFCITPWVAFHALKRRYQKKENNNQKDETTPEDPHDPGDIKNTFLYRLFYPLMAPLLKSHKVAWSFLFIMGFLTLAAMVLGATRSVPLKMLPFGNRTYFQLVLDFPEGTTLERTDTCIREMEHYLRGVPEVTDYTSYVGLAGPMDFNGMVRQYYMRRGEYMADIQVNLVEKKTRNAKSHDITLRIRDDLTAIAQKHNAVLSVAEAPPGPPVIASLVAEVYGQPGNSYADLQQAARTVKARMTNEPGLVDVDDSIQADQKKLVFVTDKEKAALNGTTVSEIARTVQLALQGSLGGTIRKPDERNPLRIELRLPEAVRSTPSDLAQIRVKSGDGQLVPLAELGQWQETSADKMIFHKNLQPVVYVFAEVAGRPPADAVVDLMADQSTQAEPPQDSKPVGSGWLADASPRPVEARTFFSNGSGIGWFVPEGIRIKWDGEGEWKTTLRVFRDLGIAFAAALVGIYILLVGQTQSFVIPLVVMLAIPLTILGIMPGFWLLNVIAGQQIGAYTSPIFFTATGMIGMIALAGIVTRDSIILVDFIHLSLARGRSLFDAIMESRVVRLRPILLTAVTAMLSAIPITTDPVFSGLAWSLIFGLFASTLFTLFVIPVTYWLLYENKPGHGLPQRHIPKTY